MRALRKALAAKKPQLSGMLSSAVALESSRALKNRVYRQKM